MDFLNKLGEKAGEAFQTVKESEITHKAKSYAGIPALSMQIGKQETIIKQAYEAIGETYYNLHKEEEDSSFSEQFKVISDAMEKIGALKAEIDEKKGGAQAACDADAVEIHTKLCPACNKAVAAEAVFCSACGHKFEVDGEIVTETPQTDDESEE
jgi:hypothetical protein